MQDNDLNDDTVKLVRWRILYTRPDYEAQLFEGEELLNYRTRSDQYGGQVMARILTDAAYVNRIPADVAADLADPRNRRYLRVSLEVLDRFPKEETSYDRRQTEALEGLQRAFGNVQQIRVGGRP